MKKTLKHFLSILLLCLVSSQSYAQAPLVFTGYDLNTLTKGFSNPYSFVELNGKFVFMAYTDTAGYEPWVSDGTVAGTFMLKNISVNNTYTSFGIPVVIGSKLYFHNINRTYDDEIWVTDGTSAGTQLVTTIIQPSSNFQQYSTAYNGKIYFTGNEYTSGAELWVSDGTATGTKMLKDINPTINSTNLRPEGSYPMEFIEFNGKLFFGADDGTHGKELWVTDGTATGTMLFKDIEPGSSFGDPTDFYVSGSIMYFKAKTSATGKELWRTDGTVTGTYMVKDIRSGTGDGVTGYGGNYFHYHNWITYNGNVFFRANDSIHGAELWVTDGTTTGTNMVKDINIYGSSITGSNGSYPGNYILYNNLIYFAASDSAQNVELWKSDGTATGTVLVKDLASGTNRSGNPSHSIIYKNHLYFIAQIGGADYRLWRSDGTDTGTKIIAPALATTTTNQMAAPGSSSERFFIYPSDSALYFQAHFTSTEKELWSLDDTTGYGPCNSPTTITISLVDGHDDSAIISWDSVIRVTKYEYYLLPRPSTPPTTGTTTIYDTIFVNGLSANTTYDICIRSKCRGNRYSAWICDTFTTTGTTGIPKTTSDKVISIYPNPSNGTFNVSLNKGYATAAITVYDMTGRVVASKQMNTANETISIGNAAKGIYNVRVVMDNAVVNKRIVIK